MNKRPSPPLLPIFRSRQQAEILALVLAGPDHEFTLPEIAERTGAPYPSVHREIARAESVGLVTSSKIGNSKLVRANTESPYFEGLADVLIKAFGPPQVLAEELAGVEGIAEAFIFGSWAARHAGHEGPRPVGDIDVLVLGDPDLDSIYAAIAAAERRLGREIQVSVRTDGWLETGTGTFHDTVASRPLLRVLPNSLE